MTLKLVLKWSYGTNRYYPDNEAAKAIIINLLGRECLLDQDLSWLRIAGAQIEIKTLVGPGLSTSRAGSIHESKTKTKIRRPSTGIGSK